MSIMNYKFDINIPDSDSEQWVDDLMPNVDYIAFETSDGIIISVDAFEHGFDVENGIYYGTMKDLWVDVQNGKYDTGGQYEQEMKDEYFELLKKAKPYEIGFFKEEYKFVEPIESRNLNLEIFYKDERLAKNANPISILCYGDEVGVKEIDNRGL